jgi:hypothetical protein
MTQRRKHSRFTLETTDTFRILGEEGRLVGRQCF